MAEPRIQDVTSPQGIPFWLVESPQIPMVNIEVTLRAGSAFEPPHQQGLASLTAALLDEGAGHLPSKDFKDALDELGARFGGGADKLDISVSLLSLTEHAAEAAKLAAMALQKPRFDDEAVARVKAATLAGIRQAEENPGAVAGKAFMKAVLGGHPYARQSVGTLESVGALSRDDVAAWHKAQFNRANMVVSVVGAVNAAEAGKLVDMLVADLPMGQARNMIEEGPAPTTPQVMRIERDLPQSTIMLGHVGMDRDHPDYYPMLLMNELLGGGGLSSRLFDVVREQHGLAYHVGSSNMPLPKGGVFMVQLQTENANVQKALDLIKSELARVRTTPPTAEEFNDTKSYMVGSFPLRIDSNAKILGYLSTMQMEGLGIDYLEQWTAKMQAVTLADIQRVAAELIQPKLMALTVVGQGPALKATW